MKYRNAPIVTCVLLAVSLLCLNGCGAAKPSTTAFQTIESPAISPPTTEKSTADLPLVTSQTTSSTESLVAESPNSEPQATEAQATAPPITEPPTTSPQTTEPPPTEPSTTTPPTTETPTSVSMPTEPPTSESTTIAPSTTEPPPRESATSESPGPEINRTAGEEAFRLQNDLLAQNGIPLLQWSEALYQIAIQRAQDISVDYSHAGCPDWVAENILMGTSRADMAVQVWYDSDGHQRNMLAGWTYGAIANYGHYWVAIFAMVESP